VDRSRPQLLFSGARGIGAVFPRGGFGAWPGGGGDRAGVWGENPGSAGFSAAGSLCASSERIVKSDKI
jgi:hypothetical protein